MAAARTHALLLCWSILSAPRTAFSSPSAVDVGHASFGSFTIELRGSYRESGLADRETLGLLVLSVPLDRFSMPKPPPSPSGIAQAAPAPANAPNVETSAQSSERVPPPAEPSVELSPLVTPALARAAVRAALSASGRVSARARLDSLEGRARSSAVLPELQLRAARTTDESLRLTPTADDPYRYTQAGAAALLFEARAAWKLDRLAFADEELAIERLRGERARVEAALTERVLSALFKWQRATLRSADQLLDPERRLLYAIEAAEAEVALDVLTAGWFVRTVKVQNAPKPAKERRPSAQPQMRPSAAGHRARRPQTSRTGKTPRLGVEDRRSARRNP